MLITTMMDFRLIVKNAITLAKHVMIKIHHPVYPVCPTILDLLKILSANAIPDNMTRVYLNAHLAIELA
jgi:hypothetical protein